MKHAMTAFWLTVLLVSTVSGQNGITGKSRIDTAITDATFDLRVLGDDIWKPPLIVRRFKGLRVGNDTLPLRMPADSGMVVETSVMGYRVQIHHTNNYNQAIVIRNDAILKFQEEVYVDYEAPNYKIRLGDFRRFEQAEELKDYVKTMGYPDAWVVKTKVNIRRE